MTGFRIEGNTSGNVAEVDANNNLKVNLPTTIGQTGFAGMATVNHDGATGASKLVRSAEVSVNRRLRVGVDNILFQDAFNYAAQNSAVWNYTATTWGAFATSGGFQTFTSTAAAGSIVYKTYKYFPMYNGAGLSVEFVVVMPASYPTNMVVEMGLGQSSGSTAPTDGVFFRYSSTGTLLGVANYAGTETTTTLSPTPSFGSAHSYTIRVEQEEVSFWVDGVLLGTVQTPVAAAGPCQATYKPVNFRIYAASSPGVNTIKLGEVRVFLRDLNANRPWNLAMAGNGNIGSQGQSGGTMGSTALMVNATGTALTATATIANGTVASGVFLGLGGNFLVIPSAAANTDGWLCAYQVPAGTVAVNGKSLVITGVKISSAITITGLTGGPLAAVYSLAYGGTTGILTVAEAATTKAYRRIPLGIEYYAATAAVGTLGQGVQMTFNSPIMVNQGEWVGVVMKNVGTAVTAGSVFYTVTFDSHWE